MKDKLSEKRIATMHPMLSAEVLLLMNDIEPELPDNVTIRVTYGLRTFEEQDALFQIGRTTKGENASARKPLGNTVTKARAGQSFHNYGLAFDFVLLVDGKAKWKVDENWLKVIEHFEKHGYTSGHRWRFRDSPHVEKTFSYTWIELLRKFHNSEFIPDTNYVTIWPQTKHHTV